MSTKFWIDAGSCSYPSVERRFLNTCSHVDLPWTENGAAHKAYSGAPAVVSRLPATLRNLAGGDAAAQHPLMYSSVNISRQTSGLAMSIAFA
jgi:hypothetical protein